MSKPSVTFVNIIETEADKQAEVVKILQEGTETVISKKDGFQSVTLLASKDGAHVINIAKWDSPANVQAVQSDPKAIEFVKRTAAIATATPGLYDIVGEYTA
ncbi:antibiotic biosynthesis monooxygenase [Thermithiobacillus plumbiphilus]|uniref:Antibiotic biosynthesis monooxygenase n=1 Tax=Thermithiobacillus plumbiphilus TaxID=1729899 RepID=A0ABU9D8Y8_9PROT